MHLPTQSNSFCLCALISSLVPRQSTALVRPCVRLGQASFVPSLRVSRWNRQRTLQRFSSSLPTMASQSMIDITDDFCGGNIEWVTDADTAVDTTVRLRIRPDVYSQLEQKQHFQYFSFGAKVDALDAPQTFTFVIENASNASYPLAWAGTTVCFTDNRDDPDSWRRNVETRYTDGHLVWTQTFTPSSNVYYFSYFPPFTYQQHLDLIEKCRGGSSLGLHIESLGTTLEGRDMHCLTVGQGQRVAWIIHRQHPGETMAEYYAEGLLTRLLGLSDESSDDIVTQVLSLYTFYIVPCMCPDGSARGHLRTNGIGANLNREWCDSPDYAAPSLERSPEVYGVWTKMQQTGVDLFLDVHGDEDLPYNFLSGAEQTRHWGPRLQALHGAFLAAYERSNSDMQTTVGYAPATDPTDALPNVATNAVANQFDCLAATLEMPFKDCATHADPERGWSPARARQLGASVLDAMVYIHEFLRTPDNDWIATLPEADAYVTPSPTFDRTP